MGVSKCYTLGDFRPWIYFSQEKKASTWVSDFYLSFSGRAGSYSGCLKPKTRLLPLPWTHAQLILSLFRDKGGASNPSRQCRNSRAGVPSSLTRVRSSCVSEIVMCSVAPLLQPSGHGIRLVSRFSIASMLIF